MGQPTQWSALPAVTAAAEAGTVGPVLRAARTAAGWTLEQVGARLQLSASVLSRLESGRRPPRSIDELRRLAHAYGVPGDLLGLSPAPAPATGAPLATLEQARDDGGDPMYRRDLLTGAAAAAAATVLPGKAAAATVTPLEDVIFGHVTAEPLPAAQMSAQLAAAGADFRACRYQQLARRLPTLIARAAATRTAAPVEEHTAASGSLARAYSLATQLLIKLHDNGMAWATADRAGQAATASGDPILQAHTSRLAATVLRRTEHRDGAQRLMLRAADQLEAATGLRRPDQATAYGHLLAAAAYTAAIRDDRDTALALLDQAEQAHRCAQELPDDAALTSIDLHVYKISVARRLGDYGAAVDYARQVDPTAITCAERRARYWEDTALALHGRGRPAAAFHALRAAEHDAPQEVRYRPWARKLTTALLSQPRTAVPPEIERFAARLGMN